MTAGERRFGGWGFAGRELAVPQEALDFLSQRVGRGDPLPEPSPVGFRVPRPRALPKWGVDTEKTAEARVAYASGQSFPDILSLRTKTLRCFPDAVLLPASPEEVLRVLAAARKHQVAVIPRGGGTSVVGGVTVPDDDRPVIVLSLERLVGLVSLDGRSGLATFRAGTAGPQLEAELAANGFWLGHEPQSFELSTVGGWVATRSAGHRSTGVGKIEDLVAGVEVALPDGLWRLAPVPASAAGPELRRVLCGSEGRLGVFTQVTLRVRPRPAEDPGLALLLPSWEEGLEACRRLLQEGLHPQVLRLSDPEETAFGLRLAALKGLARLARDFVFSRKRFARGCLLLVGGGEALALGLARRLARQVGGLVLGERGWHQWKRDRFALPYLRDTFLSAGFGVDTFETAAAWSALPRLYAAVRQRLAQAGEAMGQRVFVLCHLSHAYRDGACLYFTFFWPLLRGQELESWQRYKEASVEAILAHGGTVSHHHGVGRMHAPYVARELGEEGVALLRALARSVDPAGILNPGVFFPREGR